MLIGGPAGGAHGRHGRLRRDDRHRLAHRADRLTEHAWPTRRHRPTRRPKAFLGRGLAFPAGASNAAGAIALAEYEEDMRQAIRIILDTEPGERVMRPDFGAGLRALVFEPINTHTLALARPPRRAGAGAVGAAHRQRRA